MGLAGARISTTACSRWLAPGADIQDPSDAFRFVYAPATNNCAIVARVLLLQDIDSCRKPGL